MSDLKDVLRAARQLGFEHRGYDGASHHKLVHITTGATVRVSSTPAGRWWKTKGSARAGARRGRASAAAELGQVPAAASDRPDHIAAQRLPPPWR